MTTTPIYDALLAGITDALERKVFEALAEHPNAQFTREGLVWLVFRVDADPRQLANSKEDRQIRECIERLRDKGYPIVSTSGKAGYCLTTDEAEIEAYIGELISRIEKQRKHIDAARRTMKDRAANIREWRATQVEATQVRLL